MSDTTFAVSVTVLLFASMAAWPVFLDGLRLWARIHPLQQLAEEMEALQTADNLTAD